MWYCVHVCMHICVRVCCACMGVGWGGSCLLTRVGVFWWSIRWILRTQKYWVPIAFKHSLYWEMMYIGGFYPPYNTCEPDNSYCKRFRSLLLCLLLCVWCLLIAVDAPPRPPPPPPLPPFGRVSWWKDQRWLGSESLQKKFDHLDLGGLRAAGKIIINSNDYAHIMLQKYSPRLPSVSSYHTSHSVKQYYIFGRSTTHNRTTFSLSLYVYSHISYSWQSYGRQ